METATGMVYRPAVESSVQILRHARQHGGRSSACKAVMSGLPAVGQNLFPLPGTEWTTSQNQLPAFFLLQGFDTGEAVIPQGGELVPMVALVQYSVHQLTMFDVEIQNRNTGIDQP